MRDRLGFGFGFGSGLDVEEGDLLLLQREELRLHLLGHHAPHGLLLLLLLLLLVQLLRRREPAADRAAAHAAAAVGGARRGAGRVHVASSDLLGDRLHLLVVVGGGEVDAPTHLHEWVRGQG